MDDIIYLMWVDIAIKNYKDDGHYTIDGNMSIKELVQEYAIMYKYKEEEKK